MSEIHQCTQANGASPNCTVEAERQIYTLDLGGLSHVSYVIGISAGLMALLIRGGWVKANIWCPLLTLPKHQPARPLPHLRPLSVAAVTRSGQY